MAWNQDLEVETDNITVDQFVSELEENKTKFSDAGVKARANASWKVIKDRLPEDEKVAAEVKVRAVLSA